MKLSREELIDRIAYASQENRKLLVHRSSDPEATARQSRIFATAIVKHLELQASATSDRNELIDQIAFASGRNHKLIVNKASDPEADAKHAQLFAAAIMRNLERSGVVLAKK